MASQPESLTPSSSWGGRLAAGLFLFALALRLLGIGWGLPNALHNQSYHPDEFVIWTYSQQIEPAKLKFDPGFYNYGTLYLTTLNVASSVVGAYFRGAEGESPWLAIGRAHLAGRVLSALCGAGTVLLVFLILRRRTNLFGAALGAAVLAVAPGHVVHSRFQTVDVMATFLLAGALFFALELLVPEAERRLSDSRLVVLSGVLAGLSAGTKYTGILALLALFAALALARRAGALRQGATGTVAALVAFVVATPGAVLNFGNFLKDVRYEMLHTGSGHGLVFLAYPSGFITHVVNLFIGMGALLTLLGVAGLVGGAWRRRQGALVLLAFAVPYYVLIGRAEVMFMRYTFPLMVVLAVGFGCLLGWAHTRRGWRMALVALGIVGVGGLDGGGAYGSATMTAWMMGEDPRDAAARELLAEAKKGSLASVGVPSDPWFYTPPLYPDTGLPRSVPFEARERARKQAVRPTVIQHVDAAGAREDWDVRLLLEDKPDAVTFSSFEWNDPARLAGVKDLEPGVASLVARAAVFRRVLEHSYRLDRIYGYPTVPVHDLQYIRPTVWVWKRKG